MPKQTEFENARIILSGKQELIDGHKQNIATLQETLAMLKDKSTDGRKALKEIQKVMQLDIDSREKLINVLVKEVETGSDLLKKLGNSVNNFKCKIPSSTDDASDPDESTASSLGSP